MSFRDTLAEFPYINLSRIRRDVDLLGELLDIKFHFRARIISRTRIEFKR